MTDVKVVAFVPARGGSKSIPNKNIIDLNGWPLLRYCVNACKRSDFITTTVCSTDSPAIAEIARDLGCKVHMRSAKTATDDANVISAVLELPNLYEYDYLLLAQPTSPFVTSEQINDLIQLCINRPELNGAQTVAMVPHSNHAWNQRIINPETQTVEFAYPEERKRAYNKQLKPDHYVFGNILLIKIETLLSEGTLFGSPCGYLEIPVAYSFDVDKEPDLELASVMLSSKIINL